MKFRVLRRHRTVHFFDFSFHEQIVHLNKDIFMYQSMFLLYLFVCVSCAVRPSLSSEEPNQKPVKVTIHWQVHTSYCGGAYPTPEQQMGWNSPVSNAEFVLLKDSILKLEESEYGQTPYRTNSNGMVTLDLYPGKYYLFRTEKFQSIEALEKKYRPTNDKQMIWEGKECLLSWRSQPDLQLMISKDTTITLTENSRCFVGTTPCVHYTGPYPP